MRTTIGLAVIAMLATGCVTERVGDLTLIANRNVATKMDTIGPVRGESCSWSQFPSLEGAIDDAQLHQDERADAIANAVVEFRQELWILLVKRCFTVSGDAVKIVEAP
jgi:hypothetical protein